MRLVTLLAAGAVWLLTWPASAADRIVIAGAALTEIVFDLGRGGAVVGVDTTSTYPTAAQKLPQIGYLRALSAEGILSLAPDLILATEEAGPPKVIEQLRASGVKLVVLPSAFAADAVRQRILGTADAIDKSAEGRRLAEQVDNDLAKLEQALAKIPDQPRVMVLLAVGKGAPLAAGRDTAADAILKLAGAVNAVDGYTGYKPLTPEAALVADPAVILIPSHALSTFGSVDAVYVQPGIDRTRAARDKAVIVMDSSALLGFGPRLAVAASDLARRLHPGADLPSLSAP